jgi:NAD-dependent dihydropyrimidine dehydrogenase PreA subunit
MPEALGCKETGRLFPVIDASRCEGKEDCVRVCPYDVFEVRKLTDQERGALGLLARLKVFVHGGKQGFVTRPGDCHACGECVKACPEQAIKLRAARP